MNCYKAQQILIKFSLEPTSISIRRQSFMRLKQINLAGFKSFVDPTKIPFEQQMTAIVGPNGCGKSNIIDAVRWVLGESSAKNLRGDTMTDVIFNGAASRKPVGQASVELIFDNPKNDINASLANRNQVSIRRIVNRDSTNTYYLNNAKCRRKDITDIFLGTGLGPRSYAIIEQGTISRLIESKPQDLRIFIEEAAGISKYKERRRETETRIRHTRENLARLSDIRSELSIQVDKLHQQAEAANRFKTLKTSERKYKAELSVLRWQQFSSKSEVILQRVKQASLDLNELMLNEKQIDISLFQIKQQAELEGQSVGELQQEKLTLTQNIAKIEQDIKHSQRENAQATEDITLYEQQYSNLQTLESSSITEQKLSNQLLATQLPELEKIEQTLLVAQDELSLVMANQRNWQQRWFEYSKVQTAQLKKRSDIEIDVAAHKGKLEGNKQKKYEIEELIDTNNQNNNHDVSITLENKLLTAKTLKLSIDSEKSALDVKIKQIENEVNLCAKLIAQKCGTQQAITQNITQLKITQSQEPDWMIEQTQWLTNSKIIAQGPFHQQCVVDEKWREAVEQVLSSWLQAQVVNELPSDLPLSISLLVKQPYANKSNENKHSADDQILIKAGTLSEKVNSGYAFTSFLNQIHLADNLTDAQEMLLTLSNNESVICPDTTWLGHDFLRKGSITPFNHVLQINADIKALDLQRVEIKMNLVDLEAKEATFTLGLTTLIDEQTKLVQQSNTHQLYCQQLEQEQALLKQQKQQHLQQHNRLLKQLNDVEKQISQQQSAYTQSLEQQSLLTEITHDNDKNQPLTKERDEIEKELVKQQSNIQQFNDERYKLVLATEQVKNKKNQVDSQVIKINEQLNLLLQSKQQIKQKLQQSVKPLENDNKTLQSWLLDICNVDDKLSGINKEQSDAAQKSKDLERRKKHNINTVEHLKEQINKQKLEIQNYNLRAESALEQLKEMQQNVADIQSNMPKDVQEGVWQAHIIRIAKDINRLGPINLAAINEYENQLSRRNYLEQQNDDLSLSISTLESVITKIDKESRQKFQTTFDKVNNDLKELFPKVFGGGSAYLELTGEDLLDTGVTIMARPPGKKNSTIHLLSGGEKALTALSLVFAIFRLNPAPFCMLDEVDAPLDDANVERFCNLVREMSQTVQFIYISHNKIAMEMASHLTGVTMFEPGVSRMVAVDIDEAVAMAENT